MVSFLVSICIFFFVLFFVIFSVRNAIIKMFRIHPYIMTILFLIPLLYIASGMANLYVQRLGIGTTLIICYTALCYILALFYYIKKSF